MSKVFLFFSILKKFIIYVFMILYIFFFLLFSPPTFSPLMLDSNTSSYLMASNRKGWMYICAVKIIDNFYSFFFASMQAACHHHQNSFMWVFFFSIRNFFLAMKLKWKKKWKEYSNVSWNTSKIALRSFKFYSNASKTKYSNKNASDTHIIMKIE